MLYLKNSFLALKLVDQSKNWYFADEVGWGAYLAPIFLKPHSSHLPSIDTLSLMFMYMSFGSKNIFWTFRQYFLKTTVFFFWRNV